MQRLHEARRIRTRSPRAGAYRPKGWDMEVRDSRLRDIKLLRTQRHLDDRGFFSVAYSKCAYNEAGIANDFVQDNHSLSRKRGVVRGLHFQIPPFAQAKLVRVVRGAIFDVVVDIRAGS